jgi:hypothetical protein
MDLLKRSNGQGAARRFASLPALSFGCLEAGSGPGFAVTVGGFVA